MYNVGLIAMGCGISSVAPLGFSGDTYYMFGKMIDAKESEDGKWHRVSQVTFRNYCGTLEMLITSKNGHFLIYNKLDCLSYDEIIDEYYREFCLVKHLIETEVISTFDKDNIKLNKNYELSEGFEILANYHKNKQLTHQHEDKGE